MIDWFFAQPPAVVAAIAALAGALLAALVGIVAAGVACWGTIYTTRARLLQEARIARTEGYWEKRLVALQNHVAAIEMILQLGDNIALVGNGRPDNPMGPDITEEVDRLRTETRANLALFPKEFQKDEHTVTNLLNGFVTGNDPVIAKELLAIQQKALDYITENYEFGERAAGGMLTKLRK